MDVAGGVTRGLAGGVLVGVDGPAHRSATGPGGARGTLLRVSEAACFLLLSFGNLIGVRRIWLWRRIFGLVRLWRDYTGGDGCGGENVGGFDIGDALGGPRFRTSYFRLSRVVTGRVPYIVESRVLEYST